MSDSEEIRLSLVDLWDYLRGWIVGLDIGPYPHEQIIIGSGTLQPKTSDIDIVEISRIDALAACVAWNEFRKGPREALNNARLGHILAALGYLMGRRAELPPELALHFAAWLAEAITGWPQGHGTEKIMSHLERVASQAAFRDMSRIGRAWNSHDFWMMYGPAVKAVIEALHWELPESASIRL